MATILRRNGPYIETNCHILLVTTWIGAQTTNPNRNIAGKKNLKSLPVAFFSQKFNIDFTVFAHKMARFQNCDVIQDSRPFSKYLGTRGHFGTSIMANKIQKFPVFGWIGASEPSLSPTPYIIHWSRWQLFCVETGPILKQTAIFC